MKSNCQIHFVFLSVPADHRLLPVLEIALVTLEVDLEMVNSNVSPKVAVALHLLTAIETLQQSVAVSFGKFDHGGI